MKHAPHQLLHMKQFSIVNKEGPVNDNVDADLRQLGLYDVLSYGDARIRDNFQRISGYIKLYVVMQRKTPMNAI